MPRRSGNTLEKWEVAIVKAMLTRKLVAQDIQAYFSRPTRSINHARISEIRDGSSHKAVKSATDDELDRFLDAWPNIDPKTGLNLQGDELTCCRFRGHRDRCFMEPEVGYGATEIHAGV